MRKFINITIGVLLSGAVGFLLWGVGTAMIQSDASYSELSSGNKIAVWVVRIVACVIAILLLAWVVRKNVSRPSHNV